MLKLSVIIPCLNAEATLAVQLEALAAQEWSEPWELIISDNGSNDHSVEIARSYKERFTSFQIVDASARRGGSFAINTGAKAVRSEKFAVCDADDEVAQGWVAAMGEALKIHKIVCGQMRFDKFNDPDLALHMSNLWKDGLYKGHFLPGGGSGNFGIHRIIHESIDGFDESLPFAYDADYFWRLQLEGFTLHYLPEAVLQVRTVRVNPTLSSLYRRARNRAASNHWNYKRYRRLGMLLPQTVKKSFAMWLQFVRNFPLHKKEKRIEWLQQFATRTGDLVGQLQGRMSNPCKPYYPSEKGRSRNY